jgi:hypothetical protein
MRSGNEEKSLLSSVPEILPIAGVKSRIYDKLIGQGCDVLSDPVLLGTDKCCHSIPCGQKSLR